VPGELDELGTFFYGRDEFAEVERFKEVIIAPFLESVNGVSMVAARS